ncbi:uncharacterized protein Z520_10725 [Fonsecaea multimorphosa CBS 102226]|uniref:N-acetyltransferase domain-containing protein n=1 Tax=Fonsecaea multimorphosa CBS 102226 TaxID=1442371 RepID=A0A0D2JJZ3_9EURO|nr:uncharacterized protein Z520_10725 [Fonsecaea multimorphosa CBS 102226]KIX93547.1 hypothetical protein Z520_10725 [Fonsecaea multimorphosa CBS 102226]OAL18862.1 hypothetical protein AYO22_10191 [Fonsecaea multimorphosa]
MAPTQDSSSQSEEPIKPSSAKVDETRSGQSSQDEDGFIDIQPEDVEMQDSHSDAVAPPPKPPSDSLELQRISHSDKAEEVPDEEDDSEDDRDFMANHPLLNMLTGRLGARRRGSSHKWDHLHPENQALSVSDVDQCTSLEDAAFSPQERATREKFQYRLTRCPELSLGLFTQPTKAEAKDASTPPQRRLIAHIVSTRTPAPCVTEASMGIPSNWRTRRSSLPTGDDEEPLGHQDMGGTICVHSLAVTPEFQKMGLGSILMKSYIQRMKDSKIADRIALLAHDHLVPFYTGLGFANMGPSAVTSHGGNWNNMVTLSIMTVCQIGLT